MRRTPILVGLMCLHTLQLSSCSQIRASMSIHSGGTPQPRYEKGSLSILTLQATVLTLSLDLFCLCCINSFSFYQGSLCCRPALTVCVLIHHQGKRCRVWLVFLLFSSVLLTPCELIFATKIHTWYFLCKDYLCSELKTNFLPKDVSFDLSLGTLQKPSLTL